MYYMGCGMYDFDRHLFASKDEAKQYLLEICNKSDEVHADIADVFKRYGQVSMTENWKIVKVLDWDKRVFDDRDTEEFIVEESLDMISVSNSSGMVFMRSYATM